MNTTADRVDRGADTASGEAPGSRWIVSPGFDAFWMFAGLWMMLGYAASFALGLDDVVTAGVASTAVVLALVHAWSTTWTVLGSPLFAEARVARPTQLYVIPGVIMIGSILIGLQVVSGPTFAEGEGFGLRHWAYALYLGSFVVFHFFHFAQQDFGVLSLYRHRSKQFADVDRKVDLFFARSLTMVALPLINLKVFANSPFKAWVTSWLPVPVPVLDTLADVTFVAAMVIAAGTLLFELRKPNASFPKALYIILIGLHPLTLWVANFTAFSLVYVFSHWIIAIALAWRINRNYNVAAVDTRRAWSIYMLGFGTCIAVSLGIHLGLEEFTLFDNAGFRDHIGKASLLMGLVVGFALGEQLTHYYYDRVLFRFADPYVRERVGPLLR